YYEKIKKHHEEDFIDALNFYLKDKKSDLIVLEKEPPSLKYPWEALSLMKLMLESNQFQPEISPDASIGENAAINKNVYIGKNVSIGANTVISGPAFIGDNCRIGANNVLRGPVNLEEGTVTGALFEIKDCLIQKGTHFHSGYVGDSVVGENCKFGAGFVTANRRIDRGNINSFVKDKKTDTGLTSLGTIIGNNSSFGIKSGTMPGVLIGSDCQIGPGTLVFKNIEDGKSIFTKFDTEKK
ncbi:MAG: DapH/DapD/GlmU-related protein, partial [Candidatus Omnitrophota bacterium]